jgi:HK97 family phage prohead protease
MPDVLEIAKRAQTPKGKGSERRIYTTRFEVRKTNDVSGTAEIDGYATVYDAGYEMWDFYGPYEEVVRAGAAAKTLSEGADFALLLNHGGMTMARTRPGTLRAAEDTTGLHWSATVNMGRSDVRDTILAIEDGNLDECSFAFRVTRQMWSPDFMQREILEFDLDRGDVSVVNYGANPATIIGDVQRSADVLKSLEHLDGEHLLAATRSLTASLTRSGRQALPDDIADALRSLGLVAPAVTAQTPVQRGMSLDTARALLELEG